MGPSLCGPGCQFLDGFRGVAECGREPLCALELCEGKRVLENALLPVLWDLLPLVEEEGIGEAWFGGRKMWLIVYPVT